MSDVVDKPLTRGSSAAQISLKKLGFTITFSFANVMLLCFMTNNEVTILST